MKTGSKITILLVSATLATSVLARGPGGGGMGGGQGQMAGTGQKYGQGGQGGQGQGTHKRDQSRDPASNPTGQPIQQRDRIHTPGTGINSTVPVTAN